RISTWERGEALPSAYFREKLCTLLQMNAEQLGLLADDTRSASGNVSKDQDTGDRSSLAHEAPTVDTPSRQKVLSPSRRLLLLSLFLLGLIVLIGGILLSPLSSLFKPDQRNASVPPTSSLKTDQPNPYAPPAGRLVLNDPLRDQNSGVNWQEGSNAQQARCVFKDGAYVVVQPLEGLFHPCIAQLTEYQNFAYEVEMTIQAGEFGGILFRCEDSFDLRCYLFRLHVDGSYWFYRFTDRSIDHAQLLDSGRFATFQKGVGKTNRVAVVASEDVFTFYVNGQKVATLHDRGYTHGQIGVLAGSMEQGPSETMFQQARVWTW
ncbi:MAG TPA: hypothetical protein VFN35_16235, partial [Ktedonobacteraceae bacterium]|nr:hypothetical protein [Ktedonobacteraceae bacterium]